jgi:hypothetical protein
MSFAQMLSELPNPPKNDLAKETMMRVMALMFEIASGKTTLTSPPDETITQFRSIGMETDALKNSIRKNFSVSVEQQKLAAMHLAEEWGWLDDLLRIKGGS